MGSERCTDDAFVESALLTYLATKPEGVIIPMLALRFNAEFDQGVGGSAVERAVRELVRDGRLQMRGGKVVPTGPRRECLNPTRESYRGLPKRESALAALSGAFRAGPSISVAALALALLVNDATGSFAAVGGALAAFGAVCAAVGALAIVGKR